MNYGELKTKLSKFGKNVKLYRKSTLKIFEGEYNVDKPQLRIINMETNHLELQTLNFDSYNKVNLTFRELKYIYDFLNTDYKNKFPEPRYNVVVGHDLTKDSDSYTAYSKEPDDMMRLLHRDIPECRLKDDDRYIFTKNDLEQLYSKIARYDKRLANIAREATIEIEE